MLTTRSGKASRKRRREQAHEAGEHHQLDAAPRAASPTSASSNASRDGVAACAAAPRVGTPAAARPLERAHARRRWRSPRATSRRAELAARAARRGSPAGSCPSPRRGRRRRRSRELHARRRRSPATISPTTKARSPARLAGRAAPRSASAGGTTSTMPRPQLNVRRISARATPAPRRSRSKIAGTRPAPLVEPHDQPVGEDARQVLHQPAAGDVRGAVHVAGARCAARSALARRCASGASSASATSAIGSAMRSSSALRASE